MKGGTAMAKRDQRRQVRRLVLAMEDEIVRALKARAALEGTTVSKLVAAWVRTWMKKSR
jgi:hypothetical protein